MKIFSNKICGAVYIWLFLFVLSVGAAYQFDPMVRRGFIDAISQAYVDEQIVATKNYAIEHSGGSGTVWSIVSEATELTTTAGNGYMLDATSNAVTIVLPATPTIGNKVSLKAINSTNTCTVKRNGSKIESAESDLVINVTSAGFSLVYADATRGWVIENNLANIQVTPPATTVIGQDMALEANKFYANTGATQAYTCTIDGTADGEVVEIANIRPSSGGSYTDATIQANSVNLRGIWKFNNGLLGTDSLGNISLTNSSCTSTASGKDGYGIAFSGSSQHIESAVTSASYLYPQVTGWTFNIWIKRNSGTRDDYIFCITQNDYSAQYAYLKMGNGTFDFTVQQSGGNYKQVIGSRTSSTDWEMITCWWDGVNIKLYINAQQVGSSVGCTAIMDVGLKFNFGRYSTDYFQGVLDEASVYSTAISEATITALYNSAVGNFYSEPTITINPADDEQIPVLTDAVGDSVKLNAMGDYLKLRYEATEKKWWVIGQRGTPVDNN